MVRCHRRLGGASDFWRCQCTCLGGARPPPGDRNLAPPSETKEVRRCGHDGCFSGSPAPRPVDGSVPRAGRVAPLSRPPASGNPWLGLLVHANGASYCP